MMASAASDSRAKPEQLMNKIVSNGVQNRATKASQTSIWWIIMNHPYRWHCCYQTSNDNQITMWDVQAREGGDKDITRLTQQGEGEREQRRVKDDDIQDLCAGELIDTTAIRRSQ